MFSGKRKKQQEEHARQEEWLAIQSLLLTLRQNLMMRLLGAALKIEVDFNTETQLSFSDHIIQIENELERFFLEDEEIEQFSSLPSMATLREYYHGLTQEKIQAALFTQIKLAVYRAQLSYLDTREERSKSTIKAEIQLSHKCAELYAHLGKANSEKFYLRAKTIRQQPIRDMLETTVTESISSDYVHEQTEEKTAREAKEAHELMKKISNLKAEIVRLELKLTSTREESDMVKGCELLSKKYIELAGLYSDELQLFTDESQKVKIEETKAKATDYAEEAKAIEAFVSAGMSFSVPEKAGELHQSQLADDLLANLGGSNQFQNCSWLINRLLSFYDEATEDCNHLDVYEAPEKYQEQFRQMLNQLSNKEVFRLKQAFAHEEVINLAKTSIWVAAENCVAVADELELSKEATSYSHCLIRTVIVDAYTEVNMAWSEKNGEKVEMVSPCDDYFLDDGTYASCRATVLNEPAKVIAARYAQLIEYATRAQESPTIELKNPTLVPIMA